LQELNILFPVSGIETQIWLPPLVAFVVSLFTSMVGISGAILLLPFQVSVLGYTTPSVSATNLVYNLVAIPGGVYRYWKEGRMAWPLVWVILAGSLPGTLAGWWLHVHHLPEPGLFIVFVGAVLLLVALQVLMGIGQASRPPGQLTNNSTIATRSISIRRIELGFQDQNYKFSTGGMFALALVVGIIGGAYGIGGGAIIAPFCIGLFRLPVYIVAGAALVGTLVTSAFGIALYALLPAPADMPTDPDWLLGLLFGAGGFAGIYAGARLQKYVPEKLLKTGLGIFLLVLALNYLLN
jgi:uncharacterized membrane protein YfcA